METRALALLLAFIAAAAGMSVDLPPYETEHLLTLVNRNQPIEAEYRPDDLVIPEVRAALGKEEAVYLRPEAAEALELLFAAAKEAGHTLYAISGFRSYDMQSGLFHKKAGDMGEARAMLTVAPPGTSEHQLGLAMDVNGQTTVNRGLVQAFGQSPEGLWVAENAHRFGFIIRYPKDKTDITGYAWEPWHLRYIGKQAASEVYTLGVTFEEYHMLLQEQRMENTAPPTPGG